MRRVFALPSPFDGAVENGADPLQNPVGLIKPVFVPDVLMQELDFLFGDGTGLSLEPMGEELVLDGRQGSYRVLLAQ